MELTINKHQFKEVLRQLCVQASVFTSYRCTLITHKLYLYIGPAALCNLHDSWHWVSQVSYFSCVQNPAWSLSALC